MNKKQISIILSVIIFFLLLTYSGIFDYITLGTLKNRIDRFSVVVKRHYFISIFLFVLSYAVTIMIAVPGFAPLTMVGGYLFGAVYGTLFALIGSFIGSLISYCAVKWYLQGYILEHYRTTINRFTSYVERYGIASTLLLLHFLTIIPFFLINAFAAVTAIALPTFIWTTIVGALPLVIIYAFAGRQLHEIDTITDIFSPMVIIVFILLIVIAVIPMLFRRFHGYDYYNALKEKNGE